MVPMQKSMTCIKSDFLLCLKQRGKNDAPSKKLKKGGDEIKYKLKY